MIGKEIAHYRILDRLGGGGMGVVYKAEDTRLGRTVALKFLNLELLSNESTRKRFLHEARAASLIDHPNVCHVNEVGETDDGRTFMAMSFCEGRSLRDVIAAGPVPPREAFSIAFGIAQGLWAAHRRGIVHRDVKPANVLIGDDGFVRIVDFGLALLVGHSRVTTSGVTVGTVAYMSPEQTSDSDVGPNTDIWSLGVTLYEMLTGKLPFRGEINAALVYSIVHEPHTPLREANSSVPAECVRIVDRCLEKDPTKRYQTIEELLEDMVRLAGELGWDSTIASNTIAPILRERRRKMRTRRLALGAAVVVGAAAGTWAYFHFRDDSPYTTDVRLAVVPFDNLIGAENDALVDGLGDHVARVARWVSRGHDSMWTVSYPTAIAAQLPDLSHASAAFGVNLLISGDVQRVENASRVRLNLLDLDSGHVLQTASLPLDLGSTTVLLDSLPLVLERWFDVDARALPHGTPWHTGDPAAVRPYLEGISYQRRGSRDPAMADRAATTLQQSTGDSVFAYATCAAGYAALTKYGQTQDSSWLEQALRYGRSARRQTPALTDASLLLGAVFQSMEQADSAEAAYRFAVRVDPASTLARTGLGDLYTSQDRVQEAEESYRQSVLMNSDYWVAHRILGVFCFNQNRLDDAARAWQNAVRLAPGDILTLNNLGVVHYYRGEWRDAHATFLQSFKLRPNCESCNNVASTLFLAGKYDEAATYFELALAPEYCDSTNHMYWGNLASALYWSQGGRPRALSLYRNAINRAEAALEKDPDAADLIARLVDYYAMSGDSTRALTMITRAEPFLEKDEKVMYRVGSAYEKMGKRAPAMTHLANAVRHGYPLPLITADPVLRELVVDPRFQEMTRTEEVADGASAAKHNR